MSGNSDSASEVVDLTNMEDMPVNPLMASDDRRKRRRTTRRSNYNESPASRSASRSPTSRPSSSRSSSISQPSRSPTSSQPSRPSQSRIASGSRTNPRISLDHDDVEILDVQPSTGSLRASGQRQRGRAARMPQQRLREEEIDISEDYLDDNHDDIDIVEERRLTPQEKLKLIQEKHARGERVPVPHERHPPSSLQEIRLREFMSAFVRPGRYGVFPGAGRVMAAAFDPAWSPYSRSMVDQEEEALALSLENSLADTYRRRSLSNIKKSPLPEKTRTGFTRSLQSLDEDQTLVCICCGNELGKASAGLDAIRSSKIFVRGCGHVYCGECTFSFKDRARKDRACPVPECKKDTPNQKKNKFTQVFL